jgi:hypothetical protein
VGVPSTHPAYQHGYSDVEYTSDKAIEWWRRHVTKRVDYKIYDIQVHGGLTFSGTWDDESLWYFGFDCGHAGDFSPRMDALENLGEDWGFCTNDYRDILYVTAEVELLAKQLGAITK